jgi:hypothetical protein
MNQRFVWILMILTWPSFWNACGKVSFEAESGSNYKNCALAGADFSNCFNASAGVLKEMSQSVNVAAQNEVDILFVVDNSGSMQQEQVGIGNKIGGFLNKLSGLSWQIAITTTDDRATTPITGDTNRPWSDGQFRPFDANNGTQYILRSSQVTATDAQSKLSNAIQMGLGGSGNERGINSTFRAVERAAQPGANRDFFRPNAKLAVVLISDEDECSTGASECPAASANKSVPQNLIDQIKTTLGNSKSLSFNSIVYIPGDATCTTGANEANVYKQISDLTGGVVASVCANDYTTPLNVIGNRVAELVNSATLSCPPVDINNDGKADVQVALAGGTSYSGSYSVVGADVSFSTPLPEGSHKFYYFCR